MRFIQRLRMPGLLSFPPDMDFFDLRSLNVLVGPNASGKSNFIETFELLRDFAGAVRASGGVSELLSKGSLASQPAALEDTDSWRCAEWTIESRYPWTPTSRTRTARCPTGTVASWICWSTCACERRHTPERTLRDIMRDISHSAQRRGLTPEKLRSILNEE